MTVHLYRTKVINSTVYSTYTKQQLTIIQLTVHADDLTLHSV